MIVTGKSLSRRTVLKGLGAAISLPFLDAMTPAFARSVVAARAAPVRLAWFYVPNGIDMRHWTPAAEGALGELPGDSRAARAGEEGTARAVEPDDALGPSAAGRPGRSRPRARVVHDRRQGLQDRRRGSEARHLGRPDCRQRRRTRDAAAVARGRSRGSAAGRQLRQRLLVRVHLQPRVEDRDAAAAADLRSAHPLRASVRLRHRRAAGSAGASPRDAPEHSRRRARRHGKAPVHARRFRSPQGGRVPDLGARDRAAGRARGRRTAW